MVIKFYLLMQNTPARVPAIKTRMAIITTMMAIVTQLSANKQ